MKGIITALFLILYVACKEQQATSSKERAESEQRNIVEPGFQFILDTADVKGAILIYDLNENSYYSNDFDWAQKGQLPASTFKIANSIIGLETGVIESDTVLFKWDGQERQVKNWERELVLKDAFQFSCVPCYQEVARKIGAKRMNAYVEELHYGNLKIDSTNIDNFWLLGESRISQMQQIDFLKRFYNGELPIAGRTEKIMRTIMTIKETDQYRLSGKSGLSNEHGNYNGWYVGYLEQNNNTYFFATNLVPKKEFDFDSFVPKSLDATLSALKEMNVLN